MLVITRKLNESLLIGDATVTVTQITRGAIKLQIDAPKSVRIVRTEILDRPSMVVQEMIDDHPRINFVRDNTDHCVLSVHFRTEIARNLNLPPNLTDEECEQEAQEYLDAARTICNSLPYTVEENGCDLAISHVAEVQIEYPLKDGELDKTKCWELILAAIQPHIAQWEQEIQETDDILDVLAGWKFVNPETKELEDVPTDV